MTVKLYKQSGSLTANGQAVTLPVDEVDVALVTVMGTYSLTLQFEGSDDGTNFYPITAARTDNNTVGTTYAGTGGNASFEINVASFSLFRARVTSYTSGTAAVRITAVEASYDATPVVQIANGAVLQQGASSNNNGATLFSLNTAATTNATAVKTSAGNIYGITANNTTASPRYLRLFNKASAPTVGTDAPVVVVTIPAGASKEISYGSVGLRFNTGIALAVTAAAARLDTTVTAADDVQLTVSYA